MTGDGVMCCRRCDGVSCDEQVVRRSAVRCRRERPKGREREEVKEGERRRERK